MPNHRLKKRVFDKNQKCYRELIVHTNARLGSGVLDKNGVEIFEGDKIRDNMRNDYTVAFVPVAVSYCAELNRDLDYFDDGELEVIEGKTYEQA